MANSSDDISALWVTPENGVLDPHLRPAAPRAHKPAPQDPGGGGDAPDRQLQEGLRRLSEVIEAHRAESAKTLADQLARIRAESEQVGARGLAGLEATMIGRVDAIRAEMAEEAARSIAEVEARTSERLDRMAHQAEPLLGQATRPAVDEALAQAIRTMHARVAAVEERLATIEMGMEERIEATVRGRDEASMAVLVERVDALTGRQAALGAALRAELQRDIDGRLAGIKEGAAEAALAKLAARDDDMNDRLDAIDAVAREMTARAARAAALAPSATSVLAPIRSDIGALRSQLEALTAAVAELTRDGGRSTRRAARPPELADPAGPAGRKGVQPSADRATVTAADQAPPAGPRPRPGPRGGRTGGAGPAPRR